MYLPDSLSVWCTTYTNAISNRTGRAGAHGQAITFFTDHDKGQAGALVNVLKAAKQPVPESLLKYGTTVKRKQHDAYGAFYKDTEGAKKATKITFDA